MGFFKQWTANVSEYKRLQHELTVIFESSGVNFMHLHPEITKFLVGLAREIGAAGAVSKLNELSNIIDSKFPNLTQEQAQKLLIRNLTDINKMEE